MKTKALSLLNREGLKDYLFEIQDYINSNMEDGQDIDDELFEIFVKSGVYKKYADKYISDTQIDKVDEDAVLD